MSKLLKQTIRSFFPKILCSNLDVASIEYRPSQPASIHLNNGKSLRSFCLHCPDTPCVTLLEGEADSSSLNDFPADIAPQVCAAGAISINLHEGVPEVDNERCIACGICASRCPVGAIAIDVDKGACVNALPNYLLPEGYSLDTKRGNPDFIKTIKILKSVPKSGVISEESDALVARTMEKMALARVNMGDRFPIHHTRNLFIALGQGASMRRKGNNHMRMDILLGRPGVEMGVVEVEFGQQAALDGPRDVLDALAVLHSRYGWPLKKISPLLVTDNLPNKRSDYWEVLRDINSVTGIKIGTVTILALHMMLWARKVPQSYSMFYVDKDSGNYRDVLKTLMQRQLKVGEEPKSYIESAK